jgi:DNA-binding transcriptional ArsR family regulator
MQHAAIFSALAEPTRLTIIEMLLSRGELSAGEIAAKFNSSASAISQHLKVLREARLVITKRRAQQRMYEINVKTLSELEAWVSVRTRQWNKRLDSMDTYFKENKKG